MGRRLKRQPRIRLARAERRRGCALALLLVAALLLLFVALFTDVGALTP